ncbi:MAG: hypothetical protein V4713_13335 [Pseudomonadota bacterium]
MIPRNVIQGTCLLLLVLLMSGCSNMLPRVHNDTSPFKSFEEARNAIEGLVPMKSDGAALTKLGIDPLKQPNTVILTHADVVRRFVPSSLLKREDLDPGVLACLEARDACRGLEISGARIFKERTGNFFADFANFSRHSVTTGWRFNALILLVHDVVVYRAWGGQPNVNEVEHNTNPLGPLQEMGPSIIVKQ